MEVSQALKVKVRSPDDFVVNLLSEGSLFLLKVLVGNLF
jgi:hypothetical protein